MTQYVMFQCSRDTGASDQLHDNEQTIFLPAAARHGSVSSGILHRRVQVHGRHASSQSGKRHVSHCSCGATP